MAGRCYIGTSGWSYSHWTGGVFYPKGLKQGEWLSYYGRHFDTVEVNMSFYRMPRPEMIQRWTDRTAGRFRFALKIWRRISHEKRLLECREPVEAFVEVASGLGRRRGPLLLQLPPSLRRDLDRLETFLDDFSQVMGRSRWRLAVEFRNAEWRCAEAYDLLASYGAAICLADMPRCEFTEPNDASFVYVRRHGPGGRYRGCYAPKHIAGDARRIRHWLRRGRDVYVYYNNDIEGYAVDNARALTEAVGR